MRIQSMLFLLAGIAASQQAFGYEIKFCGDDKVEWEGTPRFRASAIGFPDGHFRSNALRAVVDRWNNSPANFRFNLTFDERGVALGNGQNEVWFTGDPDVLDGAPAAAFPWDDCGDFGFGDGNSEIEEKDVVFACDAAWVSGCAADYPDPVAWYFGTNTDFMDEYDGDERPFRTTAMHEFGHALGLKHEDDQYNVMGQDWTHIHAYGNGGTAYPGEDASCGAVRLYGLKPDPLEDVAVVHWWRDPLDGSSGAYSKHKRTRILDQNGVELADYTVNPGQRIRVEFSFENNGSTNQNRVPVSFYLSRDRVLNFGDRPLAEATPDIHRNSVYTRQQTIDLPGDLVAGASYYILAVVDPLNAIAEIYEDNNITYSRSFVSN